MKKDPEERTSEVLAGQYAKSVMFLYLNSLPEGQLNLYDYSCMDTAFGLVFFLKKVSFTVKSHRMYQWVKLPSAKSTAFFFSEFISRHGMKNTWSKSAGIGRAQMTFKQKPFSGHSTSIHT